MVRPVTAWAMSWVEVMPWLLSSFEVSAVIEIGTSCRRWRRRWAGTMMSFGLSSPGGVAWAWTGAWAWSAAAAGVAAAAGGGAFASWASAGDATSAPAMIA